MRKIMHCGVLVASIITLAAIHTLHADVAEKRIATNTFDGKLRLKKGAKYKLSFSTTSYHQSQPPVSFMRGQNGEPILLERVFTEEFSADYKVVSIDELGNYKIRITYGDRVREAKSLYNGQLSLRLGRRFDDRDIKAKLFKLVSGRSFLMKCSPTGQVTEIKDLPTLRDQIMKEVTIILREASADPNSKKTDTGIEFLDNLKFSSLRNEMDMLVSQIFSEKYVKEKFDQLSGQFPFHTVLTGEAWNYEVPSYKKKAQPSIYDPVPPKIDKTQASRIFASMDDGVVTIQDSRIYNYEQEPFYFYSIKSNATYSGISRIDRSTGMLLELTSLRNESGTNTNIQRKEGNTKSLEPPVNYVTPFSTVTQSHIIVEKQ